MKNFRSFLRHWLLILSLLIIGSPVLLQGQPESSDYKPKVGQVGKDVIWLPTEQALVDTFKSGARTGKWNATRVDEAIALR